MVEHCKNAPPSSYFYPAVHGRFGLTAGAHIVIQVKIGLTASDLSSFWLQAVPLSTAFVQRYRLGTARRAFGREIWRQITPADQLLGLQCVMLVE